MSKFEFNFDLALKGREKNRKFLWCHHGSTRMVLYGSIHVWFMVLHVESEIQFTKNVQCNSDGTIFRH